MSSLRKATATALVVCLLPFSLGNALAEPNLPDAALVKQHVDLFGAGTKVSVKLANGQKVRGSIGGIEDQAFLLATDREKTPRRIAYDQVSELKLAKRLYRASGQPDPIEAKRMVTSLGVGKHVAVEVPSGKKLHGHIQAIEGERFTLLPDNQPAPVQIAYSDVHYVEKNLSFGATIVLVVLIVAAVAVALAVGVTR